MDTEFRHPILHGRRSVWNIVGSRCRVQDPIPNAANGALVKGFQDSNIPGVPKMYYILIRNI